MANATMSSEAYRRQAQSLLESTFSRLSCAVVGIIFRQQNHNFTLAFRQLSTINETSDSDQFNIKEKQFDITDETLLVEIVILLQPLLVRPRHQVQAGRAYPVSDTKKKKKKKSDFQPKSNEADDDEEKDIETLSTKSTASFKTVLVSPGKIGLTLNINTIKGGASITRIDKECRLIGQVDVGDIIVSIDGTRITSIGDFQVNADKVRRFVIVPKNNKNGSRLDPPSSVVVGVSAATVASTVTNSKTGVDPPQTMMSAAVANIFSQPKMDIALEALLRRGEVENPD